MLYIHFAHALYLGFSYDEQRYVTLGLIQGIVVSIAHTEEPEHIHVISFRRATRNEEAFLFQSLQD